MGLNIGPLVLASTIPILQAAVQGLFGAILAWKGIIKQEDWRVLARIMYYIFYPCIIVSVLSSSVTGATLLSLWPLPTASLLNVVLGFISGAAVFPLVGMPAHLRPHFISCAGVGNLANLPLVLVPAIAAKSSSFSTQDGENGIAYVVVARFVISFACYSVAAPLLTPPDSINKLPSNTDGVSADDVVGHKSNGYLNQQRHDTHTTGAVDEATHLPVSKEKSFRSTDIVSVELISSLSQGDAVAESRNSGISGSLTHAAGNGQVATGEIRRDNSVYVKNMMHTVDHSAISEPPATTEVTPQLEGFNFIEHTNRISDATGGISCDEGRKREEPAMSIQESSVCMIRLWKVLKSIFNLQVIAAIVGLVIACTPALRHVMYGPDGDPLEGEEKVKGQLDFVSRALKSAGNAAVPSLMILLGGALSKGPGDSKVSTRAIVALIAIRLMILPIVGGGIIFSVQSARIWENDGRMFKLVMLLLQAMPTSPTVHAVAIMLGNDDNVIPGLLFWQYLASIVTIPIFVIIFLSKI